MKKYEIPLHRTEIITLTTFADSPHAALKSAKDANPGYQADIITEILTDPDDPMQDIGGESFERVATCEACEKPILTGDRYFTWEDGISHCLDCGGHDDTHEAITA